MSERSRACRGPLRWSRIRLGRQQTVQAEDGGVDNCLSSDLQDHRGAGVAGNGKERGAGSLQTLILVVPGVRSKREESGASEEGAGVGRIVRSFVSGRRRRGPSAAQKSHRKKEKKKKLAKQRRVRATRSQVHSSQRVSAPEGRVRSSPKLD